MSINIGTKSILAVAPLLTTHREITSMVLARLVFAYRLIKYRETNKRACMNLDELKGDVTMDELKWAVGQTGYPETLAKLSQSRYWYRCSKPEEKELKRVNERLNRQLIKYPYLADIMADRQAEG